MGPTLFLLSATWLAGQSGEFATAAVPDNPPAASTAPAAPAGRTPAGTPAPNSAAQPRIVPVSDPSAGTDVSNGRKPFGVWKIKNPFAHQSDGSTVSSSPGFFARVKNRVSAIFHPESRGDDYNSTMYQPFAPPVHGRTGAKLIEPPLGEPGSSSATPSLFVAPINFRAAPAAGASPGSGSPAPAAPAAAPPGATAPGAASPSATSTITPSSGAPNLIATSLTTAAASTPSALSPKMTEKVGHETDYSWITGQLRRQDGQWVLHFATPETVDRYSGHVILNAPAAQMNDLRDGDLVSAHGHVAGNGAKTRYNATAVNLIEHETN